MPDERGAILNDRGEILGSSGKVYSSYSDFAKSSANTSFLDSLASLGSQVYDTFTNPQTQSAFFDALATTNLAYNVDNIPTPFQPYRPDMTWRQSQIANTVEYNNLAEQSSQFMRLLSARTDVFSSINSRDIAQTGEYFQQRGIDPQLSVGLNADERKRILEEAKVAENSRGWQMFAAQHPELINWLNNDYNFTRVQNDVKNQSTLSNLLRSANQSILTNDLRGERGRLYWQMANGAELNAQQQERIRILNAMIKRLDPEDRQQRIVDSAGELLGGVVQLLGDSLEGAAMGAPLGAAIGGIGLGGGVVAGALIGAGRGAIARAFYNEGVRGAGNLYGDVYERTGRKMNAAEVSSYAALHGYLSAVTPSTLFNVAKTAAETGILSAVTRSQNARDFLWNFFSGGLDYSNEEFFRRTYGIGNTETYGEWLSNAGKAGLMSALIGEVIKSPAYAWYGMRKLKDSVNETETLKSGDVNTTAEVINQQVQGTPLSNVQLDPRAVVNYMSGDNVTPQDREDFQRLVKNPKLLDRALQTGGYLNVDMGTFLTINDKFYNSQLKDMQVANNFSLQLFTDTMDEVLSLQKGELEAATESASQPNQTVTTIPYNDNLNRYQTEAKRDFLEEHGGSVFNLLLDSGNTDEVKAEQDIRNELLMKNKNRLNKPASDEEWQVYNLANEEISSFPTYRATDELREAFKREALTTELFDKESLSSDNIKKWAQEHSDKGFSSDQQQAEVDRIAVEQGYSSGAAMLKEIAEAPTKEDLLQSVRQQSNDLENYLSTDINQRMLDRMMQKVSRTSEIIEAMSKDEDIEYMMKQFDKSSSEYYDKQLQGMSEFYARIIDTKTRELEELKRLKEDPNGTSTAGTKVSETVKRKIRAAEKQVDSLLQIHEAIQGGDQKALDKAETKAGKSKTTTSSLDKLNQDINRLLNDNASMREALVGQYSINPDNPTDITDYRIKIKEQEIKELKAKCEERMSRLREGFKQQAQERREKQRARLKEVKEQMKAERREAVDKQKEKTQMWKERYQQQLEFFKNYKFNEKQAKKDAKSHRLSNQEAMATARENLQNTPLGQLGTNNEYIAAIRRANREMTKAFMNGDYEQAINWGNQVTSCLAHMKIADQMRKARLKIDLNLAKMLKRDMHSWGTEENYAQFRNILSIIDPSTRRDGVPKTTRTLEEHLFTEGVRTGRAIEIPESLTEALGHEHLGNSHRPHLIGDLTLDQYKDVERLLKNLYGLGRDVKAFYSKQRKETINSLVEEQIDSIKAFSKAKTGDAYDLNNTTIEQMKRSKVGGLFAMVKNPDTFLTLMEGYNGKGRKFWIDDVREKGAEKSRIANEAVATYEKATDLYSGEEQTRMTQANIYIKEMGVTVKKDDLIGLALHMGGEHNFRKMFDDIGLARDNGATIPIPFRGSKVWTEQRVLEMLGKYLDERDWNCVETIWGMYDHMWNTYMKKREKERIFFTPEDAPKHSYTVTLANGKTKTLQGGYMPLRMDSRARQLQQVDPKSAADELETSLAQKAFNTESAFKTNRDMYKKRTNAAYIVDLDYRHIVPLSIDMITTDYAYRDWAYTAKKIMSDPQWRSTVLSHGGVYALDMFNRLTAEVTRYNASEAFSDAGKCAMVAARSLNSISLISNPATVLSGITNVFLVPHCQPDFSVADTFKCLIKYGLGDYWAKLLTGKFTLAKQFLDENYALSPALKEMGQSLESELYGAFDPDLLTSNKLVRMQRAIGEVTTTSMRFVDNLTVQPVFRGLMEKALSKGMSQQEAIRYAETGVSRIIPSDKRYEQSQFIGAPTNSWQYAINGLASFGVLLWNRLLLARGGGADIKARLKASAVYFVSVGILMPLATELLSFRSPLTSTKDDREKDSWASWALKAVIGNACSTVPIVGEVFKAGASVATGEQWWGTRTPTGLQNFITTGARAAQAGAGAIKAKAEGNRKYNYANALEAVSRAIFMTAGMPQYFNNLFWNSLLWAGGDFAVQDIFRRRPYDERGR